MKIALFGLPKSGKTTIYNALTRQQAVVADYATNAGPETAIVPVSDSRIDRLSHMYKPKKTTYATLEVVDIGSARAGDEPGRKGAIADELLQVVKNADALACVLRNFPWALSDEIRPVEELSEIAETFVLSDFIQVQSRIERMDMQFKKGQKTPALQAQRDLLERMRAHLEAGEPLRSIDLSDSEKKEMRGFQFLSQKPVMAIVNSSEELFGTSETVLTAVQAQCPVVEFAGTFEMELSQLDDAREAALFMADMGITRSARDRLTRIAYDLLGYISFFTVGDDEVRAWNVMKGDTAVQAAGAIHSDLARGFIRAECFHYDDIIALGGEKAVRDCGKLRLESKNYIVKDGDILSIRFNV